jgi:inosine-uridine nucleoside N-ribohydrolase
MPHLMGLSSRGKVSKMGWNVFLDLDLGFDETEAAMLALRSGVDLEVVDNIREGKFDLYTFEQVATWVQRLRIRTRVVVTNCDT